MVDISECRSTMENFFEDVTILTDQRHPFASKSRAEHTAYSSWTRKAWLACDIADKSRACPAPAEQHVLLCCPFLILSSTNKSNCRGMNNCNCFWKLEPKAQP